MAEILSKVVFIDSGSVRPNTLWPGSVPPKSGSVRPDNYIYVGY